jgi:cation diffusion facilitator family transporter
LLIAAGAYTYARRHARDPRFTFGTGKLGDLAAFTSAVVLAMIALLIAYESINRFLHPVAIAFDQAIPVAVLGLCVNVASAWLLKDNHDHGHSHAGHEHHEQDDHQDHGHDGHDHHDHAHGEPRKAHDLNLRAAYVHILADAAVSVLAITGLLAGRQLGWTWMDPLMGVIGAPVIANWSWAPSERREASCSTCAPRMRCPSASAGCWKPVATGSQTFTSGRLVRARLAA